MNITNPHTAPALPPLSEIESPERPATLDAILQQTLTDANDKSNAAKASIESRLTDPVDFAHPEKLIALQVELSDYNIYVSLASTLARKAVSAVETLVKAQ
ncbi:MULTISPECIES: type III secretion system inner rod subunit SctI [Burkholderia]|uniref:type III secretion system inner rod subunit SctI n=1 Tax=Burkholderia TaxID=32008 RepID=UPI001589ECEE|nr:MULTISPECIES: type III secretion system inner rod subunit SctI [Burkholderia]MCU9952219.1 type III secretion system inner rod subunit SctI [Burkholderia sp. BKH01]